MKAVCYAFALLFFSFFNTMCFSNNQIAITIDDLPFVGSLHYSDGNLKREHDRFLKIVEALDDNHVNATGFVIAGSIGKGQWPLLELFQSKGNMIGNHTYTHRLLTTHSKDKYIDEIIRADKKLQPLMPGIKYFRYPYLAEGNGQTKQAVKATLDSLNYVIAPVTVDSKDFQFNARFMHIPWRLRLAHLTQFKKNYLSYIWRQTQRAEASALKKGLPNTQILLIHANVLNSLCLGDILKMYRDKGYEFISLEEALKVVKHQ